MMHSHIVITTATDETVDECLSRAISYRDYLPSGMSFFDIDLQHIFGKWQVRFLFDNFWTTAKVLQVCDGALDLFTDLD